MDKLQLMTDSTSEVDIEIKEEPVECSDEAGEMPWDVDTEHSICESATERESTDEEESGTDEGELKPPEAIYLQMKDEIEGVSEQETDPLAQNDENSIQDGTVEREVQEEGLSFIGQERRADPARAASPAGSARASGGRSSSVWVCTVCFARCATKSRLASHARSHSAERPFECLTCGKRFGLLPSLRAHVRTHSGERPFACGACGKRFAHKANLGVHTRTHNGEWAFGCTRCSKGFAQKSHYEYHMRTHTGEKPFACGACDKAFALKTLLARHMKRHQTPDDPAAPALPAPPAAPEEDSPW